MKKIPLSGVRGNGLFALVDDEDYNEVSKFRWSLDSYGYASRSIHIPMTATTPRRVHRIKLHQTVLKTSPGQRIDHENRNRLDCQRHNLRLATHQQNNQNTGTTTRNISGFKGISWHKGAGRWRCTIKPSGTPQIHLGYFESSEEAALIYDSAAIQIFGEFAYLNIIGRQL